MRAKSDTQPQQPARVERPYRQRIFAMEYLKDLSATNAAIRAGYSEKTAYSQGHRLLKNVEVQMLIREAMSDREKRTEVTADRVVREYAKIAFSSMRKFVRIDRDGQPQIELSATEADDLDALCEIQTETVIEDGGSTRVRKTKIKLHDKLAALNALAQHTGVFAKREKDNIDTVADALKEIWRRGSKAPIASLGEDTGGAARQKG